MACQAASWIPNAVATILRADSTAQPIIAWLTTIRDSTEEYDPLVTVKTDLSDSEDSDSTTTTTPDSAFDEILSQLGKEIYKLDEYQKILGPEEQEVSLSILNIFDECLEGFENGFEVKEVGNGFEVTPVQISAPSENCHVTVKENGVTKAKENGEECSDCESTLSDVSFVTSTPAKCEKVNVVNKIFYQGEGTPVPPPRSRLKTPSSSSSCYDNMELKTSVNNGVKRDSDSDSESTCWSYKECSEADDPKDRYATVWSQSTGFHNSDEILRRVLSQNHATISRLSFDTASDFTPTQYPVYALHEVGDRCEAVAAMTPDKPDDGGYEPVRDAITTDENIYEEIEYGYSFTDEGCSCGGSVEVESCSISTNSEGVGRDSPVYANLQDNDAYAVTADVLYWRNVLLLDPYYNEDEEDEECTESKPVTVKSSVRQYERLQDWNFETRRMDDRYAVAGSPPFQRLHKKMSGSSENLLAARRPVHLPLPASSASSGDSLDVEVRGSGLGRSRKAKSLVPAKRGLRSPVPAPRTVLPDAHVADGFTVIHEGPVKRTKYFEGGKKSKKNWVDCYMILTPSALLSYKDIRTYQASKMLKPPGTPPSPTAPRPDLILPLKNAHVIQCVQTQTRRYTKSIELTVSHDRFLLQDDSEEGAKRWLREIQNVIYKLGPPTDDNLSMMNQSSNTDLESLGRTPPASRHSNRSKQKAGGSSNEDLSDCTEPPNKSHVRSRLKKFFLKRPSMEQLVKKGIYKDEPVFGRNLSEVVPADANPRVPPFVVACIKEIESNEENMCTDGLYRASGNLSQVQKIRLDIDQNKLSSIEENADIHVLTGSLKLFFRELKEPLIPCNMFDRVLAACSIKPREAKIKEFRDIVNSLPPCNRDTLKYLLEHLLRVTKYSERNRMHTANLAIVFGPTLLWAPAEQAHNIAIDCIQQNNVVDTLLTEFSEIFVEEGKARRKS
ncbi:uncharacterized protein LOC125236825 isoform X3 [Leguminivora glycinivorella]|uniref:uncharacterized protein LOC125236825 isoform X3 n=1 Tax=Leguminivora glycinivorella TaxID=1035111 RepID=UPI00200D0D32|nr:uncharacterized protein LOC125236825 isoform X3 [Leguminivora glycinivorella]